MADTVGDRSRRWAADLRRFLLPEGCVVCSRWMPDVGSEDRPLTCTTCRSRLPRAPHPRCRRCHLPVATGRRLEASCTECGDWPEALAAARWAYLMAPPADQLVHGLKYGGWSRLADEMGCDMARLVDELPGPEPSLVVPVPTTPQRRRERGYNQAELLARSVARALALTPVPCLVRRGDGPTQVALPPSRRWANVNGAFGASSLHVRALADAHVILVDDVLTTGATAATAASVLRDSGAGRVSVLTYARALPARDRLEG